jgi:hypothetical protein
MPSAPKVLSPGSRKTIQAPNFAAYGEPLCDSDGNLYFHLGNGAYDNAEILEISSDGSSGASYKLPRELVDKTYFQSFFVTPDGSVYLSVQQAAKDLLVLGFDSDGKAGGPVRLETPEHLQVQNFAVFNDGSVLVAGYFNQNASSKLEGEKYAAIFEASGKLRKRFPQGAMGTVDIKPKLAYIPDGAAALSEDGNLYLLGSDEILVFSSSGQVIRRLKFKKPDTETAVSRFNLSKGLLAITLSKVDKKNQIQRQYLVMSATSGDVLGWYVPSAETGSNDVCFNNAEGFIFMGSDAGNKMYLVTAPLK